MSMAGICFREICFPNYCPSSSNEICYITRLMEFQFPNHCFCRTVFDSPERRKLGWSWKEIPEETSLGLWLSQPGLIAARYGNCHTRSKDKSLEKKTFPYLVDHVQFPMTKRIHHVNQRWFRCFFMSVRMWLQQRLRISARQQPFWI